MTEREAYNPPTGAEEIDEASYWRNNSHIRVHEFEDAYTDGEIALAAICYATPIPIYRRGAEQTPFDDSGHAKIRRTYSDPWPWNEDSDHRNEGSRIQQLIIAGGLIAAEIDRLKRIEVQVCVPREIKLESPDESL